MEKETQSHPGEEAQETDTLEVPADNASGDEDSTESSSETVHPEAGQATGDEEIFHEEGGRKFKTKDEFVQFYRQQRGATSRVARENTELKTRLEQLEASVSRLGTTQNPAPQPSQAQIEKVDEDLEKAANALAQTKKFASPEQVAALQEQIKSLQAHSDQMKFVSAQTTVNSFLTANPDAVGHEEELADLIKEYALDKKGTEEGLRLAFQMHFGRAPKAANPAQLAQQAYKQGQTTGVKKVQAGGGTGGSNGGAPANDGKPFFNWGLLD